MQKIVNKIVIFALVVIMVGLLIFSYVSAISTYDLTVFIFANPADQQTNTELINQWAEQYAKEHADEIGKDSISVGISYQTDTNLYFSQVQRQIASGTADDVIYVSPKYVKSFALNDAVLDLTDYVDWSKYDPNGIWGSAMGAYAFVRGETLADSSIGNPVSYTASGSDGAGFYNEAGEKAGLYALPKDFSSFGLAYNRNFFTQPLRDAYTSTVDKNGAIFFMDQILNVIPVFRQTDFTGQSAVGDCPCEKFFHLHLCRIRSDPPAKIIFFSTADCGKPFLNGRQIASVKNLIRPEPDSPLGKRCTDKNILQNSFRGIAIKKHPVIFCRIDQMEIGSFQPFRIEPDIAEKWQSAVIRHIHKKVRIRVH